MTSPCVLGPPLGLGWVTGQSGVNIVHMFPTCQGGGVTRLGESSTPSPFTREGIPPHSVLETLRLRSGRTEFPTPVDGFQPTQAQRRGSQRRGRFANRPYEGGKVREESSVRRDSREKSLSSLYFPTTPDSCTPPHLLCHCTAHYRSQCYAAVHDRGIDALHSGDWAD